MYLKIDGVDGESVAKGHENEIEISSFSWGLSNPSNTHGAGGGGGAGKVTFQDIHFTKNIDKSSPSLMLHCASGEHIKKATLTVRKAGGTQQDYYKVDLQQLIISSYQSKVDVGEDGPSDQFSLNFSKIAFTYTPTSPTGGALTPSTAEADAS
jgi:type VI secretion system secreted protein Hcp